MLKDLHKICVDCIFYIICHINHSLIFLAALPNALTFYFLRFAQENGLMFLETSAKTGHAVEEAFLKCSKNILAKIETGELDPERIGSGRSCFCFLIVLPKLPYWHLAGE